MSSWSTLLRKVRTWNFIKRRNLKPQPLNNVFCQHLFDLRMLGIASTLLPSVYKSWLPPFRLKRHPFFSRSLTKSFLFTFNSLSRPYLWLQWYYTHLEVLPGHRPGSHYEEGGFPNAPLSACTLTLFFPPWTDIFKKFLISPPYKKPGCRISVFMISDTIAHRSSTPSGFLTLISCREADGYQTEH